MGYRNLNDRCFSAGLKFNITKLFFVLLFSFSVGFLLFSAEQAYALPTITWSNPGGYAINDGDGFFFTPTNTFTVDADDAALVGNGPDTIDVLISSSTGSSITLTLSESLADDGTFTNTNLIFTHGSANFQISDTATITIEDNCTMGTGNCNPGAIDTLSGVGGDGAFVCSNSDPGCIFIDLTETGPNTGIFTRTLQFSTIASDSNTATILVAQGDVIIIGDLITGAFLNGLIIPAPSDVGSIPAEIFGTVTASYGGVSTPVNILDDGAPGRGGGGAVRPGLVLNFILGIGSSLCKGDCIKPTLGLNFANNRIVADGFSYNRNSVNVEEYYTPYPLITVNVGQENLAKLKIYDNGGPENINHVTLAFGLTKTGQSMSESKASIKWDKGLDGKETITIDDPENALQDVKVETNITNCQVGESYQCLIISIYHTFRQPLAFTIVGTDVWDLNRNSKTNFYNDGIEIVGESMNPSPQFHVLDSLGYPNDITQIGKDLGLDEDGNLWNFNNQIWIKEYKLQEKSVDSVSKHGIDRKNSMFGVYQKGQSLLAQQIFNQQVSGKIIHNIAFDSKENYKSTLSNFDKAEYDKYLEQLILKEQSIAKERLSVLYKIKNNY